MRELII